MVAEEFQIYSVKTTVNIFVSQKIESVQFYSCPHTKLSPRFLSLSSWKKGIAISPEQHFLKIFFPEQKEGGEDYVVKKLPNLARVLVTCFDKFHHFCNLYSFGLCFVVQQFSFKHAEV